MIVINNDDTQIFNIIPRSGVVTYTTVGDTTTVAAGVLDVKFVEDGTNITFTYENNLSTKYDNYLGLSVTAPSKFRKNFTYFMTVTNKTSELVYRDKVMVFADADIPYNDLETHTINEGIYDPYVGASSDNEYIILDD